MRSGRARIAAASALAALTALAWAAGAGAQTLEYQVKAAYLAKFAPFVQWPARVLAAGQPLNICVLGQDPFGPALPALGRQWVGDHRVAPRRLARAEEAAGCHVLYIRHSKTQSVAQALAAVKGTPVLTVTDAADEDTARGILHFVVSANRVRFEVDAEAAVQNQLAISSKLQSLGLPSGAGG